MTSNQQLYRPTGRIVIRQIGTDHLLVPVSGGVAGENVVFPLNETGVLIWEQLSTGTNLMETARKLAEVFEVSLDAAQADCAGYVQKLLDQNLLEAVSG